MELSLDQFLAAYREKPWRPGQVDCCLFLAAWAVWLGHRDPAQHLRGSYDSEEGFRGIIERAGSVSSLVGACVSSIGGKRVQQPLCGSVGVIGSPINIHRQFGAIHDGSGWLVRTQGGIGRMTARTLAAWEI
ncbi:DUF6950 family protein [Sinorhizobium meliloti]|uniref:DUF6950 family protein n=1 Tax=Rhizobium meliloti TaxID=382 RepID=UPI0018DF0297|nr:hypothetical protein [Sinorhizobium meliloti]